MAAPYPNVFFGNKMVKAEEATLSVATAAVLYGLSVYTVFPVNRLDNGNLAAFRLKDHFRRLVESCKIIGIDQFEPAWNFNKFQDAVKQLISANTINSDVFVRATVHVDEQLPGTRSRGSHVALSMFIYDATPIVPQDGVRLKTSVWRRTPDNSIPSRAKVNGAYINSVLAKQDAIDSGYDDCIFLDGNGHVCELSAANIFLVRGGVLITPDTSSDILEGINRRTIIALAREAGIDVEQQTVDMTELYIADEVFVCGTSAFVAPVVEIDARKISVELSGSITKRLQTLHHDALHKIDKNNWLTTL